MLARAWFLICFTWFALVMSIFKWAESGETFSKGDTTVFVLAAFAPYLMGQALKRASRFVVDGKGFCND